MTMFYGDGGYPLLVTVVFVGLELVLCLYLLITLLLMRILRYHGTRLHCFVEFCFVNVGIYLAKPWIFTSFLFVPFCRRNCHLKLLDRICGGKVGPWPARHYLI